MAGTIKVGGKTIATHDEQTDTVSLANDVVLPAPTGHVIQVVTRNDYTGLSSGSNNTPQDVTGYNISFTPKYASSHLLHMLTVALKFDCDGNVKIRRGSYYSHSIGDTFREWTSFDVTIDSTPITMQWLDTTHNTTSQIDYQLAAYATGCYQWWGVGSSGDFQPYWTILEIKQ